MLHTLKDKIRKHMMNIKHLFLPKYSQVFKWMTASNNSHFHSYYLQSASIPLILEQAAALTSASQSLRRFWNAGTKSCLVIPGPTAFCSSVNLSATIYLTLQDLSSAADRNVGITNCSVSSLDNTWAIYNWQWPWLCEGIECRYRLNAFGLC